MNLARLDRYAAVMAVSISLGCSTSDSAPFGTGTGTGGAATGTGSNTTTTSGSNTTSAAGGASATGAGGASTTGAGGASTTGAGGATATTTTTSATSSSSTGGNTGLMPGDLVFTEIMNNPAVVTDDAGEWLEIHNVSANTVDLAGLVLAGAGATHTIAASVKIAPGGYAVLGVNTNAATNGGIAVDYQYSAIKMFNTKGDLSISTAAMVVIDATSYDEASGLDPDGQSRNLDPNFLTAAQNDTDVHWCAATSFVKGNAGDKGTPGKANDPCP